MEANLAGSEVIFKKGLAEARDRSVQLGEHLDRITPAAVAPKRALPEPKVQGLLVDSTIWAA